MLKEIQAITKFYWNKHFMSLKGIVLLIISLSLPLIVGIAFGTINDPNVQTLYIGDFRSWQFVLTFDLNFSLFLGQFAAIAAVVAAAYMFGEGYGDHEFLYELSFPVSRKEHYLGRVFASFLVSSSWTGIAYFTSIIYMFLVGSLKFRVFEPKEIIRTITIGTVIFIVIILINIFYLGITIYGSTYLKQVSGPLIFMILYIMLIDSLVDLGWPYLMEILHKNWPKFLVLQYHLDNIHRYITQIILSHQYRIELKPIITIFVFIVIGIAMILLGYRTFNEQDL